MNNIKGRQKGVLSDDYAQGRASRKELIFRYKVRARIVVNYIKKYQPQIKGLNILDYGSAEGLALLELNKLLPGNEILGI